MVLDNWFVLRKTAQEVTVARNAGGRITHYTLTHMDGEWRKTKVAFSKFNIGLNGIPQRTKIYDGDACQCHPRGVKLTDQWMDRKLLSFCV